MSHPFTDTQIVPPVLRAVGLNDEADRCEREGTREAAYAAAYAADEPLKLICRIFVEAADETAKVAA